MLFFQVDIDRVESVQKQFFLFCLQNLCWTDRFQLPPYRQRLLLLRDRQVRQCCVFIHDIGKGRIRAQKLRESLRARTVPYEFRATRHFEFPIHRTIYGLQKPMNRCASYFDSYPPTLDQIANRNSYKNRLTREFLLRARELGY